MHLFIDTNVFIGFYEMSSDRLDELEKLITVIKRKEATLWLPDQVRDEFWKNREGSVIKAIKEFESRTFLPAVPLLIREDPIFPKLMTQVRAAEIIRDEITERVRAQILGEQTRADVAIRELFTHAHLVETAELMGAAHERALRRLPPGKEEAIGDRLNWLALLGSLPADAELHVISDDGDYESEAVREQIKPYLEKEWVSKKNGKVTLWKRLSKYLAALFPDAENAIEMERAIAVQHLVNSSWFTATHDAISELEKYDMFSPAHADAIANALLHNSQIRWISTDSDVKNFATRFAKNNSDHIDADILTHLRKVYDIPDSSPLGEMPE